METKEIQEFLNLSTMTLGTSGIAGQPHTAPVYFVADEFVNLYFFSNSNSQHIQDIEFNGLSAASIYPEIEDWREIRGLQIHGRVRGVLPEEKKNTLRLYKAKFSFVSALGTVLRENNLYVFQPAWLRITDNRVRFGYKKEITIDQTGFS